MNFTVQDKHPSLCFRCQHGTVAQSADGSERIHCGQFCSGSHHPSQPVVRCTAYEFKYAEAPSDMRRVAWVLLVDKKAEFIGFRPPKKSNGEDA